MVARSSRARSVQKSVVWLFFLLASTLTAQAQQTATFSSTSALSSSAFTPQHRLGYSTGDQWEPAMAADSHGHIYILFPQYGKVEDCPSCKAAPTIALLVSNDNGVSWEAPRPLTPSITGQFDPQIVVDPVDKQTLYASWLQNNKRDVMVARSQDFGRTWYFAIAAHSAGDEDVDKPVLAVHGADIYVGFNHERNLTVAASHDFGQSFSTSAVNPTASAGWSLAGGATIDGNGTVYFSWTAYGRRESSAHPVGLYVSRSGDGGKTWATTLLDTSTAPPDCSAEGCEAGYLGAQMALTSDASGTLYALWNAGSAVGSPERMYFSSSTTGGTSWTTRVDVSSAGPQAEHCFPAITAAAPGDVRIAWMDTRMQNGNPKQILWNVYQRSSSNGGATWSAEAQLSGLPENSARNYDYILPEGFKFPFGDYFSLAIDNLGVTHAVWGEGRNYKSPGSIWYSRGR